MTQTIARIKKTGKHFEIVVDMEKALAFKKGQGSVSDFLEIDRIFKNSKSGEASSDKDINEAFHTAEVNEIAEEIVKHGEILVNQDYRDEEKEKKIKQVVDYIVKNAVDPKTGSPHTPERIKSALEQAHIIIKNVSIEEQIGSIVAGISSVIPLKVEMKKIKIVVPAIHTGKAYGILTAYKEKENWNSDGSLEVHVRIPAGIVMNFYDKLNSVTHGSAITEEIHED
jgi:ribosome maturation protein SDO1